MTDRPHVVPWQEAWQAALYGPAGFYRRAEGPAGHFRTACHAGAGVLAGALLRLAEEADCHAIVDVGAGRGELLTALAEVIAADLAERSPDQVPADLVLLHGVDVVDRPAGLPAQVGWSKGLDALPDEALDGALVVAWELLDVIPGPVAQVQADGVRLLLVDPATGEEQVGPPLSAVETAWCARWWPVADAAPGSRVELGQARDQLWSGLVRRVAATSRGGLLVAVDYAHDVAHRPPEGSLSAFRGGRPVPPVPDGSCDLTTHVALDSVAAAGERAGASSTLQLSQRTALRALGVVMTPADLATASAQGAAALVAQLEIRSQMDELLDPAGLGGFGWLVQGVHRPVPALLQEAMVHHAPPRRPDDY